MSVDIKNYGDADKKLIKKLTAAGKFDASLDQKLNIEKVNVEVMVRWVNERLTELLGFEDDVVVNGGAGKARDIPKAPLSAGFRSFRLILGRAIIPRSGLDASMRFLERARAEHSR